MATVRVREWTKEQLDAIQDKESHSSHDSVIKSLLKDHQLAQFATPPSIAQTTDGAESTDSDGAFDDLTVFDELGATDNGVLFLWCPNCGNEMAHLSVDNPVRIPVYEMKCQRCLTHLDHHAIIGIEIGYPIEKRIDEGTLEDDLKACVIDYWDRKLETIATNGADSETAVDKLVWQFGEYARTFEWEWPVDVAVVGLEVGKTYRDDATGERFEILECISENRNKLDSYEVNHFDGETATTDVFTETEFLPLLLHRNLYLVDDTDWQ